MAESCALSVHVDRSSGRLLATLTGEIDLSTVDQLRNMLSDSDGYTIELDMADVTFVDSTGLHALLDALLAGHQPRIVRPSTAVTRLLEVTGRYDTFCERRADPTPSSARS